MSDNCDFLVALAVNFDSESPTQEQISSSLSLEVKFRSTLSGLSFVVFGFSLIYASLMRHIYIFLLM